MRKQSALALAVFACVAGLHCGGKEKSASEELGDIIGRVEVSDGAIATSCLVIVRGMPKGTRCDEDGGFQLVGVPPGKWELVIIPDEELASLPRRTVQAAANAGFVSDVGLVRLFLPGAVGGRIVAENPASLTQAIVGIPEFGTVTAPTTQNAYLLTNVPPGTHDIVLLLTAGTVTQPMVRVVPKVTTTGVDFPVNSAVSAPATIEGIAVRDDGRTDVITVELLSALDGDVVATTAPDDDDGAFSLTVDPGAYVLVAREEGNPSQAVAPGIFLASEQSYSVPHSLVVFRNTGDCDRDGVPDGADTDDDNDGTPDVDDAFPCDPAAISDADGDGLGDAYDLRIQGGDSIDIVNPTPDTDDDGWFDFEDNCVGVPNTLQADGDGDGFGDACDNCPLDPNPEQNPSACASMFECTENDHCAGEVCVGNRCIPCTSSAQCDGLATCNTMTGICGVECTSSTDCTDSNHGKVCDDTRAICVECLIPADCGAGGPFCDTSNRCVACLTDANCMGPTPVCSTMRGECVECAKSADCSGDDVCDPFSNTCVECLADFHCASNDCNEQTNTCNP